MKTLKKWSLRIVKVLVIFIALYVIVALFAPSDYRVERSKDMAASPEVVYDQIAYFENWQLWSPWKEKDSTLLNTLTGEDGTVGAKQSWVGDPELSGEGSMTMTELVEGQKIAYELYFKDMDMTSHGAFIIEPTDEATTVSWFDEGDIPFLFRPMALFYNMDEMMGPDFERGLEKLDSIASIRQNQQQKKFEISEVDFPSSHYYGVRKSITHDEVDSAFFAMIYGKLGEFTAKNQIEMSGMPVSICFEWDEENKTADLMPAFPVSDLSTSPSGEIIKYTIPAGRAAVIHHYGSYEALGSAHGQMEQYLAKKGLNHTVVMEEYVTDPGTVESEDEILTKIYYFLE
ncbi:MAG: SRPBCC family protein [Crocinitomicaceae bacterium]